LTIGIAATTWTSLLSILSLGQEPLQTNNSQSEARKILELSLAQEAATPSPAEKRRVLLDALRSGVSAGGDNVLLRERLQQFSQYESVLADDRQAVRLLKRSIKESVADLAFRPLLEAQLPAGFPELTPVGQIQMKKYPAYRMARTKMNGRENNAFMTLFFHIKKNDIAMTAPVEMTYSDQQGQTKQPIAMSFLYQNDRLGSPGQDTKVEVVDVLPMTAVSIGLRGNVPQEEVGKARTRLERWLTQHADLYRAAGPLRVLGYNSPFIPTGRRYSEVQIPVTEHFENP
jgi:hypothetical protein